MGTRANSIVCAKQEIRPYNENETKLCVICKGEFSRREFPYCFDIRVTCGNIECTIEDTRRRCYDEWRIRDRRSGQS